MMLGRSPGSIEVVRPVRKGVISDLAATEQMLRYFIKKAIGRKALRKPRICICVPSSATDLERKAVEDAAFNGGARDVYIIEEPVAAAMGAGINVNRAYGSLIVDIGGGTTDVAAVSYGRSVASGSVDVAGDNFDEAIVRFLKKKYKVVVGQRTAEEIKIKLGCVYKQDDIKSADVRGRSVGNGLPKIITVTSDDTYDALIGSCLRIVELIMDILEDTPPQLAADISDNGILLTGGGAMLGGLEQLIESETGIRTTAVKNPLLAVALGTGVFLEEVLLTKN